MANQPNLHIFGLWEETGADTGRMCKLHTRNDPSRELNLGPWSCEAALPTTVPPDLGEGGQGFILSVWILFVSLVGILNWIQLDFEFGFWSKQGMDSGLPSPL